jgi:tetratricopeptide (TPR) repeat protein
VEFKRLPVAAALATTLAIAGCGSALHPAASTGPSAGRTAPNPGESAGPTARPPLVAESPTVAAIARFRAAVDTDPHDVDAQRELGLALAQRVRETADPSLYAPAMAAFDAALAVEPDDALALVGVAGVQLGKHECAAALDTAAKAIARSPMLVSAHAARVDALVELGRYDEADAAAGEMLGLDLDMTTLARASYLAELRGQLPTALAAMRRAAGAPGLAPENTAYVQALLGNLLVYGGDPDAARAAYEAALALVPSHAPSLAGLGRLAVGAGRLSNAIAHFERAAAIVPLPEYVIALGDAQTAAGDQAAAVRSYDLAGAEIQLFKAAGVVVDVDLAVFEADHGDPAAALRYARAAYDTAPTIRAADTVAWALHRLGRDDEAKPYVAEALRLGSIDPILRYHAGAIEAALGDGKAARRDLELALQLDSGFSAVGAAEAHRLLGTLP